MGMFPTVGTSERLADRVAAEVQKLIAQRHLIPGMNLPSEHELGEQFGVSRTVVREAVRTLVSKGLLSTHRGKGTVVCRLTSDQLSESLSMLVATQSDCFSLDHIHQVRSILEVAIVRLAAHQATEDDVAQLHVLVEGMASEDPHSEQFAALDTDFHTLLAQTTHNPFLGVLVNATRDVMQTIRRQVHGFEGLKQVVLADHCQIVECIAAHDDEGAVQAMSRHLEHARHIQHQLLELDAPEKGE